MNAIDGKDWTILAIAAYLAVMVLVRLMRNHRDQLVARFRADFHAEKAKRKHAAKAAAIAKQREAAEQTRRAG